MHVCFFCAVVKEEANISTESRLLWNREKVGDRQKGNAHIINPENTLPVAE